MKPTQVKEYKEAVSFRRCAPLVQHHKIRGQNPSPGGSEQKHSHHTVMSHNSALPLGLIDGRPRHARLLYPAASPAQILEAFSRFGVVLRCNTKIHQHAIYHRRTNNPKQTPSSPLNQKQLKQKERLGKLTSALPIPPLGRLHIGRGTNANLSEIPHRILRLRQARLRRLARPQVRLGVVLREHALGAGQVPPT